MKNLTRETSILSEVDNSDRSFFYQKAITDLFDSIQEKDKETGEDRQRLNFFSFKLTYADFFTSPSPQPPANSLHLDH